MFTRDYVLKSGWYKKRLELKKQKDIALWKKHIAYLEDFMADDINQPIIDELALQVKLDNARNELKKVENPAYLKSLVGTIGADPLFKG
jgi:hypothetical protein